MLQRVETTSLGRTHLARVFGERAKLLGEKVNCRRARSSVLARLRQRRLITTEKMQRTTIRLTLFRHQPRLLDVASRDPVVDFLRHLGELGAAGRDKAGVPVHSTRSHQQPVAHDLRLLSRRELRRYAQDPEVPDRVQCSVEHVQWVLAILEHALEHMPRLTSSSRGRSSRQRGRGRGSRWTRSARVRRSFVELLQLRNDCVRVYEVANRVVSEVSRVCCEVGRWDSRWRSRSAGWVVLIVLTMSSMLGTLAELLPADMATRGWERGEKSAPRQVDIRE